MVKWEEIIKTTTTVLVIEGLLPVEYSAKSLALGFSFLI